MNTKTEALEIRMPEIEYLLLIVSALILAIHIPYLPTQSCFIKEIHKRSK